MGPTIDPLDCGTCGLIGPCEGDDCAVRAAQRPARELATDGSDRHRSQFVD